MKVPAWVIRSQDWLPEGSSPLSPSFARPAFSRACRVPKVGTPEGVTRVSPGPDGSTSRARPKSRTFTCSFRVPGVWATMMLPGFRSRWISPFAWAASSACATALTTWSFSRTVSSGAA